MAVGFSYQIYYKNIAGLYRRGGPGGGWIYRVSRDMITESRMEAGKIRRTGTLQRSHYVNRDRVGNQYMQSYNVGNSAEHAEWVHGGTKDKEPIRSRRSVDRKGRSPGKLYITPGNGHPGGYFSSVKGQAANPWLDRACTRVAIRYGGVPVG